MTLRHLSSLGVAAAATLLSVLSLVACDAPEAASTSSDATECKAGSKLDSGGRCRTPAGRFAAASCCAPRVPTERRELVGYACPASGRVKVAFFDADSTLRVSRSGSVSANGPEDANVLPFVATTLKRLDDEGYLIAVVSNQGGIAQGHVTFEVAEDALVFTASQLTAQGGVVHHVDFAEKNDGDRKPKTGMADNLAEVVSEACDAELDLEASFMVGDSGFKKDVDGPHPDGRPADDFSNADRLFAENLGIPFHEPTDFFGWRELEVFNVWTEAELEALLDAIAAEAERLKETGDDPDRREALEREVESNRRVNGLDG